MEGRYNLCPDVKFLATPPYNGALQRFISFPSRMAYKISDAMSTIEGALIEPLSVGLHAAKRGEVKVGDTVAILGSGCIGLCTLLAAKACGAGKIFVSDIFDNRLSKAQELGALGTINAKISDTIEELNRLTDNAGADIVFETAGSSVTAAQTSHLVKRGGTVVMVGNIFDDTPYSFRNMYKKEAQIKSVFRYCNTYPKAIDTIASGSIDIKSIVTAKYPFEKTQEAFVLTADDKINCIKTVVDFE
jgi:L-iditol 2-dehydrogenase